MSTEERAVPAWPGLAGWFGLILALVWLVDPASFTQPMPAVTVGLAACWLFGCYCHLRHSGRLDRWVGLPRRVS